MNVRMFYSCIIGAVFTALPMEKYDNAELRRMNERLESLERYVRESFSGLQERLDVIELMLVSKNSSSTRSSLPFLAGVRAFNSGSEYKKALKIFTEILQSDVNADVLGAAHWYLGRMYFEGNEAVVRDYSKAEAHLLKAAESPLACATQGIENRPDANDEAQIKALFFLGKLHYEKLLGERSDLDRAIYYFNRATYKDEKTVEVTAYFKKHFGPIVEESWYSMARIYEERWKSGGNLEDLELAMRCYSNIRQSKEFGIQACSFLGDAYRKLGKKEEAYSNYITVAEKLTVNEKDSLKRDDKLLIIRARSILGMMFRKKEIDAKVIDKGKLEGYLWNAQRLIDELKSENPVFSDDQRMHNIDVRDLLAEGIADGNSFPVKQEGKQ